MKRTGSILFAVTVLVMANTPDAAENSGAQHDHGRHGPHQHHHHDSLIDGAHITVTINPEARVSAVSNIPAPRVPCGEPAPLTVSVINEGFVTSPLQASVVGSGAGHVVLVFETSRLKGTARENREMKLRTIGSNPADVTIAFSISQEIGDLGGRDRVHLLVRCDGS